MQKIKQVTGSCSLGKEAPHHDTNWRNQRKDLDNVDYNLTPDNVTLLNELGAKQSMDDYVNELFQPAIDSYNQKQKRKDRRIPDGKKYTEIFREQGNNNNQMYNEYVIQFGNHEDIGGEYYETKDPARREELRQLYTDVYTEIFDEIRRRWPHLRATWATIHFDEPDGTPHLHLAFLPIADTQNKLKMSISKSQAFKQDGLKRYEDFPIQVVENIMKTKLMERGYQLKPRGTGTKHQAPNRQEAEFRRMAESAHLEAEKTREQLPPVKSFPSKNDREALQKSLNNLAESNAFYERENGRLRYQLDEERRKREEAERRAVEADKRATEAVTELNQHTEHMALIYSGLKHDKPRNELMAFIEKNYYRIANYLKQWGEHSTGIIKKINDEQKKSAKNQKRKTRFLSDFER